MIDPALLRVRSFRWANAATVLFNVGFGASLLAGILWMQQVWGYSALRTGLAVALGPVLVPVTAVLAARLLPRARPGRLVAAGSVVTALGGVVMAARLAETPSYWTTVAPAWCLIGVGVGLVMPNLVAAATTTLPVHQVSTGSGVVTMSRQVGQVLGVSLLVCVLGATTDVHAAFTRAWALVVGSAVLAALAATAMEARRRGPTGSTARREPARTAPAHSPAP